MNINHSIDDIPPYQYYYLLVVRGKRKQPTMKT